MNHSTSVTLRSAFKMIEDTGKRKEKYNEAKKRYKGMTRKQKTQALKDIRHHGFMLNQGGRDES